MAGRPRTRERREREQRERAPGGAKPRAKRADPGTMQRVVARVAEVGAAQAAREAGISPALARKWVEREKAKPQPTLLPDETPTPNGMPNTQAERLRAEAEKLREASRQALTQGTVLIGQGKSSEARNAAVLGGVLHDRAQEVEASARLEESHAVQLTQARGQLVLDVIERGYADLGLLPVPRTFIASLLRTWPDPVDLATIEQGRAQIERPIRAAVRAELLAEDEAERLARPALPAGEEKAEQPADDEVVDAEVVPDQCDDLPSWSDLPDDFKRRFGLHRYQGRVEWQRELQRRQRREQEGSGVPTRPARPDFRHPGLRGL
jgi:hypothetical protein